MSSQYFTQSQPTQSTDAAPSKDNGLVPVTLKHLAEIGSVDGNVSLVGIVSNKVVENTDCSFTLDDGTGQIACKRWMTEDFDRNEVDEIQDGLYVRVNGRLETIKMRLSATGKENVLKVFSVRPVKNFDEVTFHFIECIHHYMLTNKSQLQVDGSSQPMSIDSSQSSPVRTVSNGFQTAPENQFPKSGDEVFDYLEINKDRVSERGFLIDDISKELNIPIHKLRGIMRQLMDDGRVYESIDENHFKTC